MDDMIGKTKDLIGQVEKLQGLITALNGKTIDINVGGDALEQIGIIENRLEQLDNKEITVLVNYKPLNAPEATAVQTVIDKTVGGGASNQPIIQPVIDKVVGTTGRLPTESVNVNPVINDTGALKDQFAAVVTGAEQASQAFKQVESSSNAAALATEALQRALDSDATTFSQLRAAINTAVEAYRSARLATGELQDTTTLLAATEALATQMNESNNLSLSQQGTSIRALTAAERELNNQRVAGVAATQEAASANDADAASMAKLQQDIINSEAQMSKLYTTLDRDKQSIDDLNSTVIRTSGILNALGIAEMNLEGNTKGASDLLAETQQIVVTLGDHVNESTGFWTLLGARIGQVGQIVGGTGGLFGVLGGRIVGVMGSVGLLHVAFDAILEAAILLTDMFLAAGLAIAGMTPAAEDVYNHLKSVYTVSEALHTSIPPLTGYFEQLQHAMAPGVVELYGAALNAINSQAMGPLGQVAMRVEGIFEDWAAKFDLWIANQKGFGKVLNDGAGYLQQFGQIIGNVVQAIDNLLKASPGTVHFLLDFFQAASELLKIITQLPTPILELAIAVHSLYVWGNVLSAVLVRMVAPFGALLRSIAGMSAAGAVVGVIAALAAGIAYLAITTANGSPATQQFVGSIMGMVQQLPIAEQAAGGLQSAMSLLNQQMKDTTAASEFQSIWKQTFNPTSLNSYKNWFDQLKFDTEQFGSDFTKAVKSVPESLASWGNLKTTIDAFGRSFKDLFVSGSGAAKAAASDINVMQQAVGTLTKQQSAEWQTVSYTMKAAGVSYSGALALMTLAGVQFGDSAQLAEQKVSNLITGYKNLGVQGGLLANGVAAVTFQTEQQNSKISALTGAFTNFISMITAGTSAVATFGNGMYTLNHDANTALASMNGLNSQSYNLKLTFAQQVQQGSAVVNQMLTLTSAAGMGAQGFNLVTSAGKQVVDMLLPFAKNSQAATDQVYALAQTAGYQGVDSIKGLTQWVGNASHPMQTLTNDMDTATHAASNLTKDMQNLSNAIQDQMNVAMAAAIIQANGGTQAFNTAANAAFDFHNKVGNVYTSIQTLIPSAQKLADEMVNNLGGNVAEAKNQFIDFYEKMGLTNQQAVTLWQSLTGKVTPSVQTLANTVANQGQQAFVNWAKNGLDLGTSEANKLWTEITSKLSPTLNNALASAVLSSKSNFEAWAGPGGGSGLGLSRSEADKLYQEITGKLIPAMGKIPANVHTNITASASGSGGISTTISGLGGATQNQQAILLFHGAATGGVIPGYEPGVDSVPMLLSKGEGILVPQAVKMLGGEQGISKINRQAQHAASGGIAGGFTNPLAAEQYETGNSDTFEQNATKNFMQQVINQYNKDVAAAKAAAAAAAAATLHPTGSGATIAALMQSMAASVGWVGQEWQALYNVEMAEAGFNLTAKNPSSGAYGLAQFINGPSEYAQYGGNANTAAGQITAMLNYIAQRYGSPDAAWAHESAYHWYDNGGYLMPGLTLAYNGTGQPERVSPPGLIAGDLRDRELHVHLNMNGQEVGKAIIPDLTALLYQKASRNNGNARAGGYWTPGSR